MTETLIKYPNGGRIEAYQMVDPYCNMLSRGVKQSDKIVVEETGVWRQSARRVIHNRIHREKQNITEVYIRTDSGLETIYKK